VSFRGAAARRLAFSRSLPDRGVTRIQGEDVQPFKYHDGQREVQREANSIACADKLSGWVGPVAQFAALADLVVLANQRDDQWRIAAISGTPPLLSIAEASDGLTLHLPADLAQWLPEGDACGGIVINPEQARRSRVAGVLTRRGDRLDLPCSVAFTNCRKYMAPTTSSDGAPYIGPQRTENCAFSDAWITGVIAQCETSFLVTATPSDIADVSHRGGPPGFLRYDSTATKLSWTEYLGDGMFVSTGNLRRRERAVLVALDFESGDAARLDLDCHYDNALADRHERVDALIQAGEPFPVQGHIRARVRSASRLVGFCRPRIRVVSRSRITSADAIDVQHPQ
jgi:hypothetical protein